MLTGIRVPATAIGVILVLQLLMTCAPPLQFLFDTRAIGAGEWSRIFLAGIAVFLLVEAEKWIVSRATARNDGN